MKLSNYYVMFKYGANIEGLFDWEETECSIYKDKEELFLVNRACVTRYYKDKPNKKIARKRALAKAICILSKEERTAIWNDYFKQVKL